MLATSLLSVFIVNQSIFRSHLIMYTINLFVTLVVCLYVGKYFEHDGLVNIATLMHIMFFVLTHHFIDKVLDIFGASVDTVPLCLPDIKKKKIITHILSV